MKSLVRNIRLHVLALQKQIEKLKDDIRKTKEKTENIHKQ